MATRASKPKDVSSRKSAQVPGQLFGYSLQPIRLLSLALDAAEGTTLSLEVFEDVGAVDESGNALASQTKSALETNPVSDKSIDLWKTFSNWKTAVGSGQIDIKVVLELPRHASCRVTLDLHPSPRPNKWAAQNR